MLRISFLYYYKVYQKRISVVCLCLKWWKIRAVVTLSGHEIEILRKINIETILKEEQTFIQLQHGWSKCSKIMNFLKLNGLVDYTTNNM